MMTPCLPSLRCSLPYAAPVLLLCLGACAQLSAPTPVAQDTSLAQAQRQSLGRATSRAAPQVQFALNENPTVDMDAPDPDADKPAVPGLAQAKTFLGTLPCPNDACEATRVSLTLAPSGHWRARSTTLTTPPRVTAEQGCWEVLRTQPLRIALLTDDTVRADLGFVQNNALRVYSYNGIETLLEYRLTQQPEIDPVDELKSQALLDCKLP